MDRTRKPAANELSGTWYSTSLDWGHHDSSGDIIRAYGTATLTQSGDTLQITDTYADGTTYQVSATWMGDRYDGTWWNTTTPNTTSTWRGELLADGLRLHGTWQNGEYSFTQYPLDDSTALATQATGASVLVLDPYEDTVVTINDTTSNIAATMYRDQTTVSGFTFVTASDTIEVTVDGRLRPTKLVGHGQTVTLVWSSDSSSAQVTVDQGGSTTTGTINVDFSDAGLATAVNAMETDTGRDLTSLRQWITANPGRVLGVVQGTESPSTLVWGSQGSTSAKGAANVQASSSNVGKQAAAAVGGLATMSALVGVVSAAALKTGAALNIAPLLLTGVGLGFVAFALAVLALVILIEGILWGLQYGCDPCNLACFINCKKNP